MSTLQTHDLKDVCAIEHGKDESPGNLVRHVEDERSFGTVVALDPRRQGLENQPQVTVLWAKEPHLIKVEKFDIKAPSRPLRAKWSVAKEEPTIYGGDLARKLFNAPIAEGEEEYGPGDLDGEQLEQLRDEADDVTFHHDGSVVVKRRARELPDYLRGPDGTIRSTYFRR